MDAYRNQRDALLTNLQANARAARVRLAMLEYSVEALASVPSGSLPAIEAGRDPGLSGLELARVATTLGLTEEGKRRPLAAR